MYTNYVDTESNRQWCSLIVFIDKVNSKNPPPTEEGKQYAAYIHKLTVDFGC